MIYPAIVIGGIGLMLVIGSIASPAGGGIETTRETEAIKSRLADLKNELDGQTVALQTCQAAEADAASQLHVLFIGVCAWLTDGDRRP